MCVFDLQNEKKERKGRKGKEMKEWDGEVSGFSRVITPLAYSLVDIYVNFKL